MSYQDLKPITEDEAIKILQENGLRVFYKAMTVYNNMEYDVKYAVELLRIKKAVSELPDEVIAQMYAGAKHQIISEK